ncbi:unnamed protein product, partial [Ascophyllum nodosum]
PPRSISKLEACAGVLCLSWSLPSCPWLWPRSPRDIKTEGSEIQGVQYASSARTSIQQAVRVSWSTVILYV